MGLLDSIIGSVLQQSGQGSSASGLQDALTALLTHGSAAPAGRAAEGGSQAATGGGLDEIIGRFREAGFGHIIDSWIGQGENKSIEPGDLHNVLGSQIIDQLARRTGLSQPDLLKLLSTVLPGVVDGMTPNGRVPDAQANANADVDVDQGDTKNP